ncbi:MAG TPA: hypothetical protein VKQ32_07925, partial [Polyangia bacterium]|nr:hypothetical protein [Polyangia bacterium]
PPSRHAPNNDVNATVDYDMCTSNDSGSYLISVKQTANALKALKADPSMVAVVAITGAPTPYQVHWKNPSTADNSCGAASCPWPEVSHSCTAPDGSFADPGVRTAQLVGEFGANGLDLSICDASFGPSFQRTGDLINSLLGPRCLPGRIGLKASTGEPDCTVTEHDGSVSTAIPSCVDSANALPCWSLQTVSTCASGQSLAVTADPNASTSATITYDCAKCVPTPAGDCQ